VWCVARYQPTIATHLSVESGRRINDVKRIGDLIAGKPLVYVESMQTVRSAAGLMTEKSIGAVAVLDSGTLVGMFSERDLMTRVVASDLDPSETLIQDVMTRDIAVAAPTDSLAECLQKMHTLNCRHLPVVEGDNLIGMISLRDLLQIDSRSSRAKAEFLTELVTYSPDYES